MTLGAELIRCHEFKNTSFNKKIRGNFSSFLSPENDIRNSVFKPTSKQGMRSVKEIEDDTKASKRELFLKGDFSNLYNDLELWKYHDHGHTGKGIKIAIFDSGISKEVESQLNIVAKVDFTGDTDQKDISSHGTFIASVIGSKHSKCPGIAPDAELYIFKVFNRNHDSYTEWFLNAFNYAIEKGIDIINLSNGSSDFQDNPFIDKINEIIGKGITVVSSIGNDGPEQGTLNNPADMTNVIGVGSLNQAQDNLAHFSSRGITTWNLLKEVGIIKPDVITLGEKIGGLDTDGACTVSSGTSVSSGIISGSLAVILSHLKTKPSPALIKRSLLTTSTRLLNVPISDQGSGVFSIDNILNTLKEDKPLSMHVHPEILDLTSTDYSPFSIISFYSTMIPVAFNFTVIHPESRNMKISEVRWENNNDMIRKCIFIDYESSSSIVPFYSQIRMRLSVQPTTECQYVSAEKEKIVTLIAFENSNETASYTVVLNLKPTPMRGQRILIDAFHNLKFPEDGYILRDSIFVDKQPYEWKGDHVFTNYMQLYKYLSIQGYSVEVLNEPITCFDSKNYGTFILADPEKALSRQEVVKLRKDIETRGLSLIVIAEWSDQVMKDKHTFTSEFTRKTWNPVVAGSNLDSINTLLKPYGIMFRESSYSGTIAVGEEKFKVESGAIIQKFPNKGFLFSGKLVEDRVTIEKINDFSSIKEELHPIVGIYDLSDENNNKQSGSILAIGDSY